jgi:hypothetical protein
MAVGFCWWGHLTFCPFLGLCTLRSREHRGILHPRMTDRLLQYFVQACGWRSNEYIKLLRHRQYRLPLVVQHHHYKPHKKKEVYD